MHAPNRDKEQIISLVNRLLDRSGLAIDQVLARMQAHGCDISRSAFENCFTTRAHRAPNIPPHWALALIAAFTERLTDCERCTAAEAIELARLARLPIDQFQTLKDFFPEEEFLATYSQYAPVPAPSPFDVPAVPFALAEKQYDAFITCHAKDEGVVQVLVGYLQETGLTLWPAVGHLTAAGGWPTELSQVLAACRTWLICLGPETIDDWLVAELRHPLPPLRGVVQIIPVLLPGARRGRRSRLPRFLQRTSWFELHDDLKNRQALARLVAAIEEAKPTRPVPEGKSADLRCPYRGLQVFDEEHAEFFFGRQADVEWLLEAFQHGRFLAVIGPSGIGKSSVVRAGLIPVLRRGAFHPPGDSLRLSSNPWQASGTGSVESSSKQWLIQVFEPGRRPLEALAVALLEAGQMTPDRSLRTLIDELETDERGLHLLALEILARQPPPGKSYLALVVDQFEEVFTLCEDEAARQAFIANLLYAASLLDGQTVIILTMRADFYSRAALYPDLAVYLADQQVLISPMAEPELIEAITRPAQKVGLHFEPGLVDRLLQDAATEPGTLPLLQHALLELWERRDGVKLTLAAYQASGGVRGALTQRAERILAAFTPTQQAIVRRVMLRLTRLGEGTADTRRLATLAELVRAPEEEADVRTVVTELANARLVTTAVNRETGEEIVEVAHEALIRGWPTLQSWLAEDREALRRHQQLAEAALEWERNKRDESYLYRGARLAAAAEWAKTHAGEMNLLEQDFLTASLAERDRVANEQERRRRRVIWGLSLGLVVTLIGLAVVLVLGRLAFDQWRQLEAERQAAFSRQLAAHALDRLDDQLDLALLLSVEAYQVADTFEARSSLLTALEASHHLTAFLRGHTDWAWSVAFSPDGQTLASGSADGTIILWDVATGQPLGSPLIGHTDWINGVSFSPDGETLASGSADGTVILWDVATGQPLGSPLTGHTSFVTGVAFSPDGETLASGSADGTIILWDISPLLGRGVASGSGQALAYALTGHTGFVFDLAFSSDGRILASGSEDNSIILWDVTTRQPLGSPLTGHKGTVSGVAFSPDGQTLASGSADGTIILWDVSTSPDMDLPTVRRLDPPLTGHESDVTSLAFSPDGRILASGSEDRTIILWDATRGATDEPVGWPIGSPLRGHIDQVLDVAFSPSPEESGRQMLASSSADGTVLLWDVKAGLPLSRRLTGHTDLVTRVAFSPNPIEIGGRERQVLASGSRDQTLILWDMETLQPLDLPLTGHTNFVNDAAFSPKVDAEV